MTKAWMGTAAAVVGLVLGCVGPQGINYDGHGGKGTGGSTGTGTTTIGGDSGLPCDVAALLSARCTSCHGSPPIGGAPMSLLTLADLKAPAKSDASKSVAEVSLARMQDGAAPMPPKPAAAVPAADVAAFQAWVAGGLQAGACGADAGAGDTTFNGPSTCESGTIKPTTYHESPTMNPGQACVACHTSGGGGDDDDDDGDGPDWRFGGTVFALGHVPDGCQPTAAQVADLMQSKVVIVDANGTQHSATPNKVGNFYDFGGGNIVLPYTAKVVYMGKERVMSTEQTSGDCNACHTDAGTNGAPGRIALPQ